MSDRGDDNAQEVTFALLARDLPRVAPPADLLQRIVLEAEPSAARTPDAAAPTEISARRRRPRRRVHLLLVAAGLAAALVAAVLFAPSGESPAVRVDVGSPGGRTVGTLALYEPRDGPARVVVTLVDLEDAPAGHHYTAWILGTDGAEMTPIGSFDRAGETTELRLPLPDVGRYAAFDVSVQADDASPEHSGVSVAGARLR